jgi:hypothetical protein
MNTSPAQKYIIGAVLVALIVIILYFTMKAPVVTTLAIMKEKLDDVAGNKLPKPVITLPEAAVYKSKNATKPATNNLLPIYEKSKKFGKDDSVTDLLKEQNFVIGGYASGINTVLQSNKIPYLDIRSLPPIPKINVGEWNQSSYEQTPGQGRKGFEIGPN